MCGFAGIFLAKQNCFATLQHLTESMTAQISHRGPDDSGVWKAPDVEFAFGFRRLSIIDVSRLGHQPMHSMSGRYVLVFNGEIYNYRKIRGELEKYRSINFRGHSDTEVVLAAFERWGIAASIPRFIGMFAMAVWDTKLRELTLIRDRLGIKPVYFYSKNGTVLFGSELKSLLAYPHFDRTLDSRAVADYFRYLYIPAPATIFAYARKLMPGVILTISDPHKVDRGSRAYWELKTFALEDRAGREPTGEKVVDEMEDLLRTAVRLRLRSDVPVGSLLSGGVDSSLVTALMQEESAEAVRTFSIGFEENEHDESAHAAAVARYLGTRHTEVRITKEDLRDTVPRILGIFDEPFANPSNIPTLLLCEAAKKDVTVALSGDGGDEVFAGYNRYLYGRRIIPSVQHCPIRLRKALASLGSMLDEGRMDKVYSFAGRFLPARWSERLVGQKITKLAFLLRQSNPESMYRSLVSAWHNPERILLDRSIGYDTIGVAFRDEIGFDILSQMQLADQLGYLPDDLLAKLDRVSMAVSLEVRVPLLDHHVVEASWRLPTIMKVRRGVSKWILREILYRRIPRSLIERPKMGFTVPLAEWLSGPLREWAGDLLAADRLRENAQVRTDEVARTWEAFLRGRKQLAPQLWTVLMFEAWLERWG